MYIQKVMLNKVLKQYGLFFAGIGTALGVQYVCENAVVNNIKSEIMIKYPERYKQIEDNSKKLSFLPRKTYWNKALTNLQDSAMAADIAKRTYNDVKNKISVENND